MLEFREIKDVEDVKYFDETFARWVTQISFQGRVRFLFSLNSVIYEIAKEPTYYA